MAADISTLRLLIGDRAKAAVNEVVGEGDGVNLYFQLDMFPVVDPATATLSLLSTGVAVADADYTISGEIGRIIFTVAIGAGHTLLGNYEYYTLTSGELTDFLSGHTGEPFLAASNAALAIAGDTAKLFKYTMGDKSVDKSKVAKQLRELSKDLLDRHFKLRDDDGFGGTVFTFKDNTATPYRNYDSAVAYLNETS